MKRSLAFVLASGLTMTSLSDISGQENKPVKRITAASQPQPVLVGGTEFIILDSPPSKPIKEANQLRLPIMIVVLFWIGAMFLWQIYFNKKIYKMKIKSNNICMHLNQTLKIHMKMNIHR